jgi:signal transduction histidine kinase/ligand-binding sensor domain-containing protein
MFSAHAGLKCFQEEGRSSNMKRTETQIKTARALVLLGTLYVLLWCHDAPAQNPSLDVSQYAHTVWTDRDGFMQGAVNAIAQTPDGYLCLGTQSGVVRFDGVRAVPLPLRPGQQLPSTSVGALLAARDGTLWIGTLDGLVSWKNGQLTAYPALARRTVLALVEDRAGTVWAGGLAGPTGTLCAIRRESTTCYGDDGSLGTVVASLYEDSDGSLWVGAATGLWRWGPGPSTRYLAAPITRGGKMTEGDHGSGLVVAVDSLRQIIGRTVTDYPLHGVPLPLTAGTVLRDRNGGLWIGTTAHGIVYSHEGKTSAFTHNDGLSSDQVHALFEGREGSIWVATAEGLDQFRELPVTSLPVKQGLSSAAASSVLAARDGSIWVGTSDGLYRWKEAGTTIYRRRRNPGLADDDIQSLFEDERGRIWVSSFRGLAAFEKGKFTPVPSVPAGAKNAIAGDNHGGLWLSLFGTAKDYSLAHLAGGKIVERVPWLKLGGGPGTGLVPDPDGGIWTGLLSGGMAYFRAGQIRNLPLSDDGASARRVLDLARDRDGSIWATTNNGVSRINNGRVATLTTANGLPCNTVHWIIEDDLSSYWLYAQCGLLRIARTDMDSWIADPKRAIRPTRFGVEDGVRLVPILKGLRPAVTKASDGRIWFVNGVKVSFIDPSRVTLNTLPPPVHIEQITGDGITYEARPGLRLPPHVRNLLIDYTALSLVVPGNVKFRVMLEGQDKGWREVVNQRHVQYTNLAPGNYRFRVIACNNSGVWNEQGASLEFVIPPAWYQTNWFRAACVVAFAALLWALYQLRLRQIAHAFNARLEERVAERTRIARDLHDTLLQSFQGLLLRFQTVRELLRTRPAEAEQILGSAIDQTAHAITEGRNAVQGLRASTVEHNDLAAAITTLGEELAAQATGNTPVGLRVDVEGTSRTLHPIVRDEIYRIASEALRNAFRHAEAKQIEVELRYDERQLRLRVRDDGKGIEPNFLTAEGRAGHFGLHGMHERAELIGGKVTVWSAPESGTEIELSIPAARAYAEALAPRRSWFGEKLAKTSAQSES